MYKDSSKLFQDFRISICFMNNIILQVLKQKQNRSHYNDVCHVF